MGAVMGPEGMNGVESRTLDDYIAELSREGYSLVARSATTAQLIKPKKFSFGWSLFWFLFFGVGVVVYILYYLAKKDEMVFLQERDGYITGMPQRRKQYGNDRKFLVFVGVIVGWTLLTIVLTGFLHGLLLVPSFVGFILAAAAATGLAYLVVKKFW